MCAFLEELTRVFTRWHEPVRGETEPASQRARLSFYPRSTSSISLRRAHARADPSDDRRRPFRHPRLGFFGVIDERMDVDLVGKSQRDLRPDWHFVMIGPVVMNDEADVSSGSYANPLLRSFIVAQRTAYQLTRGRIGGRTLGADTMLLTTRGARSSEPRTTPLIYLRHGEDWVIFATDNASDRNPAWCITTCGAHREAEVQIGAERFRVRATLVPEPERGSLWEQGKRRVERFSTYEQRTSHPAIPVFRLRRIDAGDRSRDVESIRTLIYRFAGYSIRVTSMASRRSSSRAARCVSRAPTRRRTGRPRYASSCRSRCASTTALQARAT